MPRYYFHVARDGGRLQDEEGLALPDAEAAWYQAVRSARELEIIIAPAPRKIVKGVFRRVER